MGTIHAIQWSGIGAKFACVVVVAEDDDDDDGRGQARRSPINFLIIYFKFLSDNPRITPLGPLSCSSCRLVAVALPRLRNWNGSAG
jgi:hypothetical protein